MIEGGCTCGAVRYSAEEHEPFGVRMCWCAMCRKVAGGNAAVNVMLQSEKLTITGEMADAAYTADSGTSMHRRFCPKCGTHLFSNAESRPHVTTVRTGTLDDPNRFRPQAAIWVSNAPAWASIPDDVERFEGQPPPPQPLPNI
jgi:hypothetical protein